jgi:hypothetical protein
MESKGRGVLDTPHAGGMTTLVQLRYPFVIASEAKQSISPGKVSLDCLVAEPVIGRAFARPVGSSQ